MLVFHYKWCSNSAYNHFSAAPLPIDSPIDTCVNPLLSLAFHLIACGWGFHLNILFSATPPIPLHALAALIAMLLGGVQLYLSKGTPLHKLIGRIWIGLMAVVSLSSFFIYELKIWGNYSPIHLLSIWAVSYTHLRAHET